MCSLIQQECMKKEDMLNKFCVLLLAGMDVLAQCLSPAIEDVLASRR